MKVIFEPAAQNTIIRPMAQAVCIAQGGKDVDYIDTADHKKKTVGLENLSFLTVQARINKRDFNLNAYDVAMKAKHEPVLVQVNVNDVKVLVSPTTTVEQAMAQFHKKLKENQQKMDMLYAKACKLRASQNR